ncbi:hypothetical protein ACF0H5_004332 [Mactra antiquata]
MECKCARGPLIFNSLKIFILCVILSLIDPTYGKDKSWTFNIPGVSFLSFSPVYTNTQNQRISLSFKTRQPHGLIFCHYLKDLDAMELERLNYQMCAEIQYGIFVLTYKLKDFEEVRISVGKALNNEQWHQLEVYLDIQTGELKAAVDNEIGVVSLKQYTRQEFSTLLDWSTHSSAIYFGGTDPNTLFSEIHPHFIGCLKNIHYFDKDENFVEIPVSLMEGVVEGCLDQCENNPCHHGGHCINDYSKPTCDCFGTDYQGQFCSALGPSMMTLQGYEWLTYNLHENDQNVLTEKIRLSLEFKTSRGSGVLFYAVGGAPYHSHVTASVHAGTVEVSVAVGDEDIHVSSGIGLDDYRWHNLTILHDVRRVYVYLDGREHIRDIEDDKYHLGLDPKIFIGGGDDFIVTRGLQVTQNFVGCVKNIYVNEISVLYELEQHSKKVQYHGGGSTRPEHSCHEVINIPISFPTSASMLKIEATEDMAQDFEIEFDFKTVRSEAILFYASIEDTDHSREYNLGYIEVWLHSGQPNLKYVASTTHLDRSQNLSISTTVNDNTWHSMYLTFNHGIVQLKVDGNSVISQDFRRPIEIRGIVVVGYGFNTYKESEGFVGCIRNLKVQGHSEDALDLVQTRAASGLIIDGCNITNYCEGNRMCQHGGICLSEWNGVACDCSDTHYIGTACHFAKYKHTCDEYYQSGVTESGVMLVDLDGSGPMDPVYVKCEMGHEVNFEYYGKTVIDHNLAPNSTVRQKLMRDLKKYISYRGLDKRQLLQLTEQSGWCEQYIRYDCQNSPIRLSMQTWFRAANDQMVDYLGTNKWSGDCTCSIDSACTGDKRCNCDNGTMSVQHDAGYNSIKTHLPLVEIDIRQDEDFLKPGSGNITLGPLMCWGSRDQDPLDAVTFNTKSGYLLSQPWKSHAIRVSFRTHHDKAIILYQTGTEENINYFFVAVTSEFTVKFYFRWGIKKLDVDIVSPVPVNNGQWHQISIEADIHNVRCMFDMTEKILDIPIYIPKLTLFSGVLYIGGVPKSLPREKVLEDVHSIMGCMRGLEYNNKAYPLSSLIDYTTKGVEKECMASCWPNPCKNGAKCIEEWSTHRCVCVNPWSQSGHNCEIDINTDSITLLGTPESYLHFIETKKAEGLLDSTILFNFRTFKQNCLLLYMHDHFNNFIQVELTEGNKVIAKFNRFTTILEQAKTVQGYLADGEWNQVVIDNVDGYIKVIVNVDDEPTRNSYRKLSLETYSPKPFQEEELVIPDRPSIQPEPGVHVYVGGVPGNMSTYPTLHGCIRGLKIGGKVFKLQETAGQTPNVSPTCIDGCEFKPCKNGGYCEEQWHDGKFACDCSESEYAGPTCNTESAGLFGGQSILQYKYTPEKEAQETNSERLELIFKVNKGATKNMVLAFIFSERYWTHDFIVVYLDPNHGVYLNTNQGYSIHGVGKGGLFADGRPHQLLYRRNKSEMILTIDEEGVGRVTVRDNALDELDTIMIGGILDSQFADIKDTDDYINYDNFTGCMSEVTFYPVGESPFKLRPLKDLRDNKNSTGQFQVFGPEIPKCRTRETVGITTTTTPAPTKPPTNRKKLTLPPWNPGPAKTEYSGPIPKLPTSTTPVMTQLTTPSSSRTYDPDVSLEYSKEKFQDEIIVIAIGVIAFLLIVAVIIAVVLIRMKRKEDKMRKEKQEIEHEEPLNEQNDAEIENHRNQNYLARLDEFSMVSATLGPKPNKTNTSTFKPNNSESTCTYTSVPQSEEDNIMPVYPEHRFYNRKKNRPASSISEVLEFMERNNGNKDDSELDEFLINGNGPLLPVTMETRPLSCHDDDDDDNDADNESESPSPPPPPHHLGEYNGDSGYEAESKPDEEQETLMKDIHGIESDASYPSDDATPSGGVAGTYVKRDKFPPSPSSKNSNYVSDTNSPFSHSDTHSSGDVSPTVKNNSDIMNYGFPNPAVIELNSDVIQQKPNVTILDENHV